MICESPQNRCFIALSDADDHKSDHERTVFGQLKKDSVRLSSRWMTTNLTTKKKQIFPPFFRQKYLFPYLANPILTIFLKKELSFGLKHDKLLP
ncbi:MAG: hypothetical protein K2P89_10245, partial [Lachnospiraceae bacterium]|nr:hypothetical protein [Lachnospiraceae bacterium]